MTKKYRILAAILIGFSGNVFAFINTPILTAPALDVDGNYTVAWTTTGDGYTLKRNNVVIYSGAESSVSETNLTSGNYSYSIQACGLDALEAYSCSTYSLPKTVVVNREAPLASAPVSVTVDGTKYGEATISWVPGSGIIDRYTVRKRSVVGPTNPTFLAIDLPATTVTFTETGIATGDYLYSVQACNDNGCDFRYADTSTAISNDGVSAPDGISGVPATSPTNRTDLGQTTISWGIAKGNVGSYRLLGVRLDIPGAAYKEFYKGPARQVTLTNLIAGGYYFIVEPISTAGISGPYAQAFRLYSSFTRKPDPVNAISFSKTSPAIDETFNVFWEPPIVGPPVAYYKVFQRRVSPELTNFSEIYRGTATSVNDIQLDLSGEYHYGIESCSQFDECSAVGRSIDYIGIPASPAPVIAPSPIDTNVNHFISWKIVSGRVDRYEVSIKDLTGNQLIPNINVKGKSAFTGTKLAGFYRYSVRACIDTSLREICGPSSDSGVLSVGDITGLTTASVFSVSESTNQGDFILTWAQVAGAGNYKIFENDELIYEGAQTLYVAVNKPTGQYTYQLQICEVNGQCGNLRKLDNGPVTVVNDRAPGVAADGQMIPLVRPVHDSNTGELQGEGAVSGGNASYNIPIFAPPGRLGMAPNISLNYSSSAGNGIAGVGFSLGGLSSISRCGRTFARDGINAPINLTFEDNLCFSGQVLVLVSGQFGRSGSEYRTENDSGQKIELTTGDIDGDAQFTVTNKNGTFSLYGNGGINSVVFLSGTNTPIAWSLIREQDPFGNSVIYDYTNDQSQTELLIDTIHYTGKNDVRGNRGIRFVYEDKPIPSTSYMNGGIMRSTKQLKSIVSYIPENPEVRSYTIVYRASNLNGLSLVSSIEVCASNSVGTRACKPSTRFEWEDNSLGFEFLPINFTEPFSVSRGDQFEIGNDIDGDGRNEIVVMEQYTSAFDVFSSLRFTEFGDDQPRTVKLINLDENGNEVPLSAELEGILQKYPTLALSSARRMFQQKPTNNFDFNKDGRADLITRSGSTYHIIYTEDGQIRDIDTLIPTRPFGSTLFNIFQTQEKADGGDNVFATKNNFAFTKPRSELFSPGDFNSDGKTDFAVTEPGGPTGIQLAIYLDCSVQSAGQSIDVRFCRQVLYDVPASLELATNNIIPNIFVNEPKSTEKITLAPDLDGNGLPDFYVETGTIDTKMENFVIIETINNRTISHVLLTQRRIDGAVYIEKKLISALGLPQPIADGNGPKPILMVDINGDGRKDYVSKNKYRLATGNPLQPFTIESQFTQGGIYEREPCYDIEQDPFSCDVGVPFGTYRVVKPIPDTTAAFYAVDVDADGVEELFYPKTVLVAHCRGTYLLAPGEPQPRCAARDSEVRHVYQWQMIDYVENTDGTIRAVHFDFDGQLISSPESDGFDDINGDGKPELFGAMGYLEQNFFNRASELPNGFNYDDGSKDIYIPTGADTGTYTGAYFSKNTAGDNRITKITTGLGMENKFFYQTLANKADLYNCGISENTPFYEVTNESVGGAYFHFTSTMDVIAKFEQSDGIGGFNETCYRYKDNMFNHEGRGIQGFERIIVEQANALETQNNIRMVMDFHQKFPLTGRLQSMRTELVSDDINAIDAGLQNPLSKEESDYNLQADESITIARVLETEKRRYSFNYDRDNPTIFRDLLTKTTVAMEYGTNNDTDDHVLFGRPSKMSSLVEEFSGSTVVREYRNDTNFFYQVPDTNLWAVNLLERKVETEYPVIYNDGFGVGLQVNTNVTRTTETVMDISPATRFVNSMTVLPGQAEEITVINTADSNGNVVRVEQSGLGVRNTDGVQISRIITSDFSQTEGFFANRIDLGLGMFMTMEYDVATGKITKITDANGLVTNSTYDAFGVVTEFDAPGTPPIYTGIRACGSFEVCTVRTQTTQDGAPEKLVELDVLGRIIRTETTGFDNTFSGAAREAVITVNRYDALGHLVEETGPHYESDDESDDLKPTTVSGNFDALDRPGFRITEAEPQYRKVTYDYQGFTTQLTLDTRGNNFLTELTDNPLQTVSRTYNSLEQLVQTVDQMGNTTTFRYDGVGNVIATQVNDALDASKSMTLTMTYNALGQRSSITNPNSGTKFTVFNGLNELMSQTDANGDIISFDYDALGRIIRRKINNQIDIEYGYDSQLKGLKDFEHKVGDDITISFEYDSLGRITRQINTIPDMKRNFETRMAYDSYYGRVKSIQYPSGDIVAFLFDKYGFKVSDVNPMNTATSNLYQRIQKVDARGNVVMRTLGNGIEEIRKFRTSGQLLNTCATANGICGEGAASYIEYGYDAWGDLRRVDNITAQYTDLHSFDALHRLTQSQHNASAIGGVSQIINYNFDGLGNLLVKDDYATNYQYGGNLNGKAYGPNQVRQIAKVDGTTTTFDYDANGNLLSGDGRTLVFNAINKPIYVSQGSNQTSFFYGPDDARYKQVAMTNGKQVTTFYLGKLMEWTETRDAITGIFEKMEYKTYVSDYLLINREIDESTNEIGLQLRYKHNDLLGSTDTITDEVGNVLERRSHDPFGKPRDNIGNAGNQLASDITPRGFTDHEHLDGVELIHMNGRVYDFNLGRFLGVDPFVVNPKDTQSYNSYSYVLNNPLSNIDPTGYACRAANGSLATQCGNTADNKRVPRSGKTITRDNGDGTTTTIIGTVGSVVTVRSDNGNDGSSGSDSSSTNIGKNNVLTSNSNTNNDEIPDDQSITDAGFLINNSELRPGFVLRTPNEIKDSEDLEALRNKMLQDLFGDNNEVEKYYGRVIKNLEDTRKQVNPGAPLIKGLRGDLFELAGQVFGSFINAIKLPQDSVTRNLGADTFRDLVSGVFEQRDINRQVQNENIEKGYERLRKRRETNSLEDDVKTFGLRD